MAYTWDKANADAPDPAHHAILRDARQPRHLSRRLGGGTTPATLPWELSTRPAAGRDHRLQLGTLQRPGGSHRVQRPGRQDAGQAQGDAGPLLFRGEEVQRAAARQLDARALEHAAPEPHGGTNGLHLFGRTDRRAGQRRAEHPEQVLHHHRRGRDPRRRRGRHDRHRGRALRRLRPVPEQGRVRASAGARSVFLYNLLDLKRTTWEGPELEPGKHTIVFDFKSDGPGLGKGGTGVLSVDGKEVAKNSMEHTTPITFPEDETFDVGQDTRTGVALVEYRYDVPFKFTGKIDKLTFKLEPAQRQHRSAAVKPDREAAMDRDISAMKKVLIFAAVAEAATGAGVADRSVARRAVAARRGTCRRRHTGGARGRHRPDRVGGRLLAGPAAGRHVDLQRGRHAVSRLPRLRRRFDRRSAVAGGRPARGSVSSSRARLAGWRPSVKRGQHEIAATRVLLARAIAKLYRDGGCTNHVLGWSEAEAIIVKSEEVQ